MAIVKEISLPRKQRFFSRSITKRETLGRWSRFVLVFFLFFYLAAKVTRISKRSFHRDIFFHSWPRWGTKVHQVKVLVSVQSPSGQRNEQFTSQQFP